jgi:hypothetical protein
MNLSTVCSFEHLQLDQRILKMDNVMTMRAYAVLSELGSDDGIAIHFMEAVKQSLMPDWKRILQAIQPGEAQADLHHQFREVLKSTELDTLLYSGTVLRIMPDERDELQMLGLWEWFEQLTSLTIKVVGEDTMG